MRTPRDLDGDRPIKRLRTLGYEPARQGGSRVRLTRESGDGDHRVTVPVHSPLRVGTPNAILGDIAGRLGVSEDDLIRHVS